MHILAIWPAIIFQFQVVHNMMVVCYSYINNTIIYSLPLSEFYKILLVTIYSYIIVIVFVNIKIKACACTSREITKQYSYINIIYNQMWPDLPKPATIHIRTQWQRTFSSPIKSSINKLTNCHSTTATSWLVCFFWGLFLRPVRRPRVLGYSWNITGWIVQVATLLKITTWLVHDVGHGFSYIL